MPYFDEENSKVAPGSPGGQFSGEKEKRKKRGAGKTSPKRKEIHDSERSKYIVRKYRDIPMRGRGGKKRQEDSVPGDSPLLNPGWGRTKWGPCKGKGVVPGVICRFAIVLHMTSCWV